MSQTVSFGAVDGVTDAFMQADPALHAEAHTDVQLDSGSALYAYKDDGKINGILVADGDRGLPIDREDLLQVAFDLSYTPHVAVFEMPGGYEDGKYKEIMDRVYGGSAVVVHEERTYDHAKGCYVILLRYDDVCYRLNGRYKYLKEQLQ